MQKWVVICWALLAVVGADECPDGGRCEDGQACCPFDQAECCEDHIHCCPAGTVCDAAASSCVNATVSIPWVERASADQPRLSKSFRMIRTYMGEEEDNICPDQSRCPPEFSCLRALTRFGCCPLTQGVPCSDGKHCCPEGHQCSADSRSCIKKELVTTVLCSDGVSECPDETTCSETPEGKWGCCPMAKAVCCSDKIHCCPEGSTCDVEQSKCISSATKKEMPMWAKLPARVRAEWENRKEGERVKAEAVDGSEKATTVNTVPPSDEEVFAAPNPKAAPGNDVACNDTVACADNNTCCKTKTGDWACCPLPEAVCCQDLIHCCPKGKKCNTATQTCEDDTCSVQWVEKVPTIPWQGAQVGNVACDSTFSCRDGHTCCMNQTGGWACCPLAQAVCCDDHEHCCPSGTTCNLATFTCVSSSGSTLMKQKLPAFSTEAPTTEAPTTEAPTTEAPTTEAPTTEAPTTEEPTTEAPTTEEPTTEAPTTEAPAAQSATVTNIQPTVQEPEEEEGMTDNEEEEGNKEAEGMIRCDAHSSCPEYTTCCFMASSQTQGCCPLPEAVCCTDGNHCCPTHYKCNEHKTSCEKGDVVIPWYTKLPATSTVQADPSSVQCDGRNRCPEHATCCRLYTGEWGCCPLQSAVCCPDKEHCCPQGYTCNIASHTCQKLIMLQLETVPLTPVYLPVYRPQITPLKHRDVPCDEHTSCQDGETCCRTSATTWGCCPEPNGVCCSDMQHCCPNGYTCTKGGDCTQDRALPWLDWHMFLANKKRALIV